MAAVLAAEKDLLEAPRGDPVRRFNRKRRRGEIFPEAASPGRIGSGSTAGALPLLPSSGPPRCSQYWSPGSRSAKV